MKKKYIKPQQFSLKLTEHGCLLKESRMKVTRQGYGTANSDDGTEQTWD